MDGVTQPGGRGGSWEMRNAVDPNLPAFVRMV